jgi:hypothetical protein
MYTYICQDIHTYIYVYTRVRKKRYARSHGPMVLRFGTLGPGDKSFRIRFKRWSSDRTVARRVAMADHGTAQPWIWGRGPGIQTGLGGFDVPKRRIVGVNATGTYGIRYQIIHMACYGWKT